MTSISEDQTLPLGLENTLNQLDYSKADSLGTANDVSTASEMSEHHYPQRSVSPVTISTGTGGKLSPQRSRLMRDQEMQLSELKKDNFGLKLRIYHLEEALRKQLGNDSDDWRLNIDLNVQLDSLKKDLQEKSELLLKAKHAMDGLSMQHEGHVKKLNQDFGSRLSEEKRRFQEALADKERDISELKKRCSKHEQAEEEMAVLRGELGKVFTALQSKDAALKAAKDAESETEPLRRDVARLRDELAAAEKEIEILNEDVEGKNKELRGCHGDIASKDKEVQRLTNEIHRLRSHHQRAQDDEEEREERVKELQEEVDRLQQEVKNLKREAADTQPLRTALKKKDSEIDELKGTLKDLERELGSARKDLLELTEGNMKDRDQLARELSEATDDNDHLRDQLQDLQDRLDSLKQELARREDALSKAKQAVKEKEKKINSLDKDLMKLSADKAAECSLLQRSVDDLNNVVHDQEEMIKDLNDRLKEMGEELNASKHSVRRGRVDGHSATLHWPSDQWADGDSGIEELQAEVLGLKKKLKKKDVELAKLRDALEDRDGPHHSPGTRGASVGSQTPPLINGSHSMADLEAILTELRNLMDQLGNRTQGDTTNYFNLSRQPQDKNDVLERLLTILAAQPKESHIIQPSPVHVNVTVPSSQAPSIITVPSVGEVSPQVQRRMMDESSQTRITTGAQGPKEEGSGEALSALHQKVGRLQRDLEDKDEEINSLHKALRNIEGKLREREGERARLNDRLVRMKSSSSEQDAAAESLQNTIAELEKKLRGKDQELSQATMDTVGLRRDLSAQEEAVKSLRNTASDLARKLESNRLAKEEEVGRLVEENAKKDAKIQSLQKAVGSLRHELEKQENEGSDEVSTLRRALKSMEAQRERESHERDKVDAMLTGLRDEVEGRDRTLQDMQASLKKMEGELEEREMERRKLLQELETLKRKNAQLEKNTQTANKSSRGVGTSPSQTNRSGKGVGTSPSQPVLNSSREDSDLSGIYDQLRELDAENMALRDKLQKEDDLAEESQIEHISDMDVLQSKLDEAQEEISQLKDLLRRSRTPDSRAGTPFGGVPPEVTSRGVQTTSTKVAHKAVLVRLGPAPGGHQRPTLSPTADERWRPMLLRENTDGLTLPTTTSTGVQHVGQDPPATPPSTPPEPLNNSWTSTASSEDDQLMGSHGDDSHMMDIHGNEGHHLDLSALDDQYQESLRLNKLAQERISQQLAGGRLPRRRADKKVGTPKVTSAQVGTSPDVVEDLGPVVRELRARLAGSAKELRSCQKELSIANREVKTMNNEVEKLQDQQDREVEDFQQQIKKLSKDKGILLKKYRKAKENMASLLDQLNSSEAINSGLSGEVETKQKELENLKDHLRRQAACTRLSTSVPALGKEGSTGQAEPMASSFAGRPSEMSFRHPTAYSTPFHPHTARPVLEESAYTISGRGNPYEPPDRVHVQGNSPLVRDKSIQCSTPSVQAVGEGSPSRSGLPVCIEDCTAPVEMVSRGVQHRETVSQGTQHSSLQDAATQRTGVTDRRSSTKDSSPQRAHLSSITNFDTLPTSSTLLGPDHPHLSIYPLSPEGHPPPASHLSDEDAESVSTVTTLTSVSTCDPPTSSQHHEHPPPSNQHHKHPLTSNQDHKHPPTVTQHHEHPPTVTQHHKHPPTVTQHHKHPPTVTQHHEHQPTVTQHHEHPPTVTQHHKHPPTVTQHHKYPPTVTQYHEHPPTVTQHHDHPPTGGLITVDRGTDPVKERGQVDKMIQTVQDAQKRLTHMLSAPDLNVMDRKFLEELLQCLQQQERELEEGRRLLMNLTSPLKSNASVQASLVNLGGSQSKEVYDLSKMYQDLLETRSHLLSTTDKVRRFTTKKT